MRQALAGLDFDPARPGLFDLGHIQLEHAVLEGGSDLRRIQLAAQGKAAFVLHCADLRIDRLNILGLAQADRSLDGQGIAVHPDRKVFLCHARQIGGYRDAHLVLNYVHRRNERRYLGAGRLTFDDVLLRIDD